MNGITDLFATVKTTRMRRQLLPSKKGKPIYTKLNYVDETKTLTLYVASCGPFTKVGVSEQVIGRLKSMQSGCPYPIHLRARYELPIKQAVQLEHRICQELEAAHHMGEWFRCPPSAAIYAIEAALKTAPPLHAPVTG